MELAKAISSGCRFPIRNEGAVEGAEVDFSVP
jgi:hypothetical protein